MKGLKNFGTILILTYFLAFLYVIWRWPYTPQDVMEDMTNIGPYGIILDVAIIILLYRWYKNRKKNTD